MRDRDRRSERVSSARPHRWDPAQQTYARASNHAGGIEGGITNGEPVIARCYMKPLSTLNRPVLKTVDVVTKEETVSFKERTDHTACPPWEWWPRR